ncbi:MAG TPA: NAD(P)/FAD-dependent oxidoreductase [Motilibacterales bacterium]|nr:NAD(P)/FAD-dependent oxidoreductase [Motilibacterales bacterium]
MTAQTVDAVVVGSGPNGLVAANVLVDAGWDVVLIEAAPEIGGAVRSGEVTAPGFVTDLYSSFYPLSVVSPAIRDLDLGAHGLVWRRAPAVLGHAFDDGRAAVLHADPADTAASVDQFAPGDGEAWLAMFDAWLRIRDPFLDALLTTFPPVAGAARTLARLGTRGTLDFARLALSPVRRFGQEQFGGQGARALLTGNALHGDVPPDSAGSALFGWLLAMLGQDVGFPVPQGGAGMLARALHARATAQGLQTQVGTPVTAVLVEGGRAAGVRLADGRTIRARRGVLADVAAPHLYRDLVGPEHLPRRLLEDLERFHWDSATVKVNWALSRPIPWRGAGLAGAGTVHLGVDDEGFVDYAADLSVGRVPHRPFLLLGQMSTADPTRSPAGTESVWAYTHVPHTIVDDEGAVAGHVERMEAAIEHVAPGFGGAAFARSVQSPADLESANANLLGGATNAGTAGLHQQLVLRPTPGLGRPETPLPGLYLASASAHPGGGVHGACGWNAARVALRASGRTGGLRSALARTAWARVLPDE